MSALLVSHKWTVTGTGLCVNYRSCGEEAPERLVVFLHGFPETSASWEAQLAHFGSRGWWAVAPDQRGYGRTTGWDASDVASFSAAGLAADVVAFVSAVAGPQARFCLVAHDFGVMPATLLSLARPDLVRALCCLSVPLLPPAEMVPQPNAKTQAMFGALREAGLTHYMEYLVTDAADAEFSADYEAWLARMYYATAGSGDIDFDLNTKGKLYPMAFPLGQKMFARYEAEGGKVATVPPFAAADLATSAAEFGRNGVRGATNWYRNLERNAADLQAYAVNGLKMPYLYVGGEKDFCLQMWYEQFGRLDSLPGFQGKHVVSGAGHWVHREAPQVTNAHLETFLNTIPQKAAAESHRARAVSPVHSVVAA